MDTSRLEMLLRDAFAQAAPGLGVEVKHGGLLPGRFYATLDDRAVEVAWLSVGWPRQVRELLAGRGHPDLVFAPELSPGARSMLEAAGVSWVDGTGAARVALPG